MKDLWRKLILRGYRRYWSMPARRRRAVGWTVLLLVLFVACGGLYGSYRGVKYMVQWTVGFWEEKTDPEELHPHLPLATTYTHRHFEVREKHPRRRMNYSRDFNDLNDTQLSAARRLGITPQKTRDAFLSMAQQGRLVRITETQYYLVDRLTHSSPYLVPEAADFLVALGQLMQEYDGTPSRFIITSLLRADSDVRSLSRSNKNASQNSAHCYATTLDITYNRFDRRGATYDGRLKENLARALYDLQQSGHCYVKHEVKQACFHITVRPRK